MYAGAPVSETLRRRPRHCARWHARAFGVDLALDFDAPALSDGAIDEVGDATTLELVYASSLDEAWRDEEAQPLGWMPDGQGGVRIEIRQHPELGVMFAAGSHGRYMISPDARHVACAPPAVADWYWQRMLVGQVLPLVAALRGHEVIHASAVALGDHAIAIAGRPGAGKSTLALELVLAGRGLVAEDVIPLRVEGDRVLAEPGVSLLNLRPTAQAWKLVRAPELRVVGQSDKIHVLVPRVPNALPLSTLYLLERAAPGTAPGPAITTLPSPSPADLIGTAFVPYLTGSEHLLRHLEFAQALARSVRVARVVIDPSVSPAALAQAIEEHAA